MVPFRSGVMIAGQALGGRGAEYFVEKRKEGRGEGSLSGFATRHSKSESCRAPGLRKELVERLGLRPSRPALRQATANI